VKQHTQSILRGPPGSFVIAQYLRFVSLTSRHIHEPRDPDGTFSDGPPVIYATWHGQNFIFAFRFTRKRFPTLLVAHHGDGQMIGRAMRYLGVPLLYGSGAGTKTGSGKGGARAFLQMMRTLRDGQSVTLTADVPKVAREVGEGIVLLARKSGTPIVPVAMASSRRRIARSWDRMQINLPFSRLAFVAGEPIHVPDDGSEPGEYQARLAQALERAQERAFLLADQR